MIKRCLGLLLAVLMMIPAASLADEMKPKGRYVESRIPLPESPGLMPRILLSDEGELVFLGDAGDGASAYKWDGENWIEAGTLPRSELSLHALAQRGGATFAVYYHVDGDNVDRRIGRYVDGVLTPMDANLGGGDPDKLDVAQDGTLLAWLYESAVLALDPNTGAMLQWFDGLDGAFAAQGNDVFGINKNTKSVMQYDVATGKLVAEMKEAPVGTDYDAIGSDGTALYIANDNGIHRIASGGSIWEQVVDGTLTSLGLSTTEPRDLVVQNGDIYVLGYFEGEIALMRYRFDAGVDTQPTNLLRAYTLYENFMLTQAATQFQRDNPEYQVDITVLLAEGTAATEDDVIRALNTEILAGQGPDLLLLDGMPIPSYIEKGVLADLSPLISELDGAGELVPSVFGPLYRDGKIFYAPMSCWLPAALVADESLLGVETLADLEALIGKSEAGSPMDWLTRKGYFSVLKFASYPAWFAPDGQLNEAAFAQYLTTIDRLHTQAQAALEGYGKDSQWYRMTMEQAAIFEEQEDSRTPYDSPMGVYGYGADIVSLMKGRTQLHPVMQGHFGRDMEDLTALDGLNGSIIPMPGQAKRAYVPTSLLGVNARSAHLDAALQLVRTAMSQSVQDVDTYGGLPVNPKSLAKLVAQDSSDSMVGKSGTDPDTGERFELTGVWPVRAFRERIAEMLTQAQTPYIANEPLLRMIKTELAPFFAGEMDAQAAAQAVSAKVRAYLAE